VRSVLLADLVLLLHLIFILWVIGGGLLVWRRPRLAWLHLPAVVWGVLVELNGWLCPLTPLEDSLRGASAVSGRQGDMIERLLTPLIYPDWLSPGIQCALGLGVLLWNLAVYVLLWRSRGHQRRFQV